MTGDKQKEFSAHDAGEVGATNCNDWSRPSCGSILDTIGNTPIVRLNRITKSAGCCAEVYAKLEYFNPFSSVKDRAAYNMIRAAEQRGDLIPGKRIISPTSGNIGISLACVGVIKGYSVTLTMPDNMSVERIMLISHLGAETILTPAQQGMKGAIEKAREIAERDPDALLLNQFEDPANKDAHEFTTAQEIWQALDGKIDAFVAGVGTGGTIQGVGEGLRKHKPDIGIYAVEPAQSPVLSGGTATPHQIQGIGSNFIPPILDPSILSGIIQIDDAESIHMARTLAREEGLLVGISSGAAVAATMRLATMPEMEGKTIVTLLADSAERYLSTNLYQRPKFTQLSRSQEKGGSCCIVSPVHR